MAELRRDIGLWRGIALNMIDMVGIGPFITIPFILTAMGGGRGMLAWILGGLLAISDGLVTAELAAELPASGGSYVFLREAYGKWGRLISFLFLFQILFSAPLSMASGCIGFANYLQILIPGVSRYVGWTAAAVCVITVLLLLRRIESIGKFSILLWVGVMATLAIVIGAGLPHLKLSAFTFWNAPRLDHDLGYAGLGVALIYAVYDYLGYYNICYLGDEVRDPHRTIPRVIVISILAIGVIYLVMNACLVSVLPMDTAMTSKSIVGDYLAQLLGKRAAQWISLLILWTAFASIFSLMLGYSRILYAAARDNNFFSIFAKLHPTGAYPIVSILFLGTIAAVFCFIPLKHVLQAILSIRAIIPFMAQIVGALILRRRDPDRVRPFRMWLYPLPAITALGLWSFIVISPEKGLKIGGLYVIGAGVLFYVARNAFERAAVSTEPQAERQASNTAVAVAAIRAVHQLLDDSPKVLDDPISPRLLSEETIAKIHENAARARTPWSRGVRAHMVMRSRYAEDQLAAAQRRGVTQCVVLGAGLDTFAYRQPEWAHALRIYEVDQPASQADKRRRLEIAGVAVPANVELVSVDFERESLRDGLQRSSFRMNEPAFFSWLGVTMYLTEEAIDEVLRFVLSLPPSSEIVFTFAGPASEERGGPRALSAMAAEVGEPWKSRFVPEELERKLLALGFTAVTLPSAEEIDARYFRGRNDLLAPRQIRIVSAIA